MNENVQTTQQQEDTRAQDELTSKVGVKLTEPEKSTTSPWSTVKRILRIG
jgi:hypothetical protein